MEKLPKITSCFGVIIEENQAPPRIYLIHNNADPLGPNGEEGKPDGWGLPGGGSLDDEKPYEEEIDFPKGKFGGTVRREVLGEAGLLTEIATRGNTEFGEILLEHKPYINNDILIFHLKVKEVDDKRGFRVIEETTETRKVMLADLGSILMMPSAIKIIRQASGEKEKINNSEGIYFSARERIFGLLHYLDRDFYQLIPDLDNLIGKISREEVGGYIYELLTAIVKERQEVRERHIKLLLLDDDELLELYANSEKYDPFIEILERYRPWIETGGIECQK